MIVLVIASVKE